MKVINFIKKKLLSLILIIISLSIFWFGCVPPTKSSSGSRSDDDNNIIIGNDISIILPLKIGNNWVYNHITTAGSFTRTLSITDVTNIGGVDVYRGDYSSGTYEYYGNHIGNGLFFYGDGGTGIISPPYLNLQYPCSVGDSWIYDRWGSSGTYIVQSISTIETVSAGSFECIVYYYRRDTGTSLTEQFEYWAPGIGLIRNNVYRDHNLIDSIELVSYSIL